jgi:hypothetical protein
MNYRNDKEARYFGSDLNKWVNEKCSKEMTAINMDLIMWKRSKRMMKIIESKHTNEEFPKSQVEILRILAKVIKPVIDLAKLMNDFNVYVVTADYPYSEALITDISTDTKFVLSGDDFKKWLEFDYTLTDIDKLDFEISF